MSLCVAASLQVENFRSQAFLAGSSACLEYPGGGRKNEKGRKKNEKGLPTCSKLAEGFLFTLREGQALRSFPLFPSPFGEKVGVTGERAKNEKRRTKKNNLGRSPCAAERRVFCHRDQIRQRVFYLPFGKGRARPYVFPSTLREGQALRSFPSFPSPCGEKVGVTQS